MSGWIVKETQRSGWRGMRSRLRFAIDRRVRDRVGEAAHAAASSRFCSSVLGLLGRVAGERDEHVVERRPPHGDVGDPHAARCRAGAPPRRCRRARVFSGITRIPCSHFGRSSASGARASIAAASWLVVLQRHLEALAAHAALQLVGRALGDHPPVVDHGDAVGEPVGLVQVLGREQHGRAGGHARLDRLPELEAADAGRARWWARRGTAPAGAPRAPPPGRACGACRPSRSSRGGRRRR